MINCTSCGRYLTTWRSTWSACLPHVKLNDGHVHTCMPCRLLYITDPRSIEASVTETHVNDGKETDMTS